MGLFFISLSTFPGDSLASSFRVHPLFYILFYFLNKRLNIGEAMAERGVDLSALPKEVRDQLAELDLELSEGKTTDGGRERGSASRGGGML